MRTCARYVYALHRSQHSSTIDAVGTAIASTFPAFAADNPDESFFKKAAEAGMAEVDGGHTAQEKGSSQAVKDFGAMIVRGSE